MAKIKHYKLGDKSSIFFDSKSKLKVTKGVPGKTDNFTTNKIKEAIANGHIIEISPEEFETMLSKLPPSTAKAIRSEQKDKASISVKPTTLISDTEIDNDIENDNTDEENDNEIDNEDEDNDNTHDEREALLKKLKKVASKKNFEKFSQKSNDDIKRYLADNE